MMLLQRSLSAANKTAKQKDFIKTWSSLKTDLLDTLCQWQQALLQQTVISSVVEQRMACKVHRTVKLMHSVMHVWFHDCGKACCAAALAALAVSALLLGCTLVVHPVYTVTEVSCLSAVINLRACRVVHKVAELHVLCLQLIWSTALQLLSAVPNSNAGKKEQDRLEVALTGRSRRIVSSSTGPC